MSLKLPMALTLNMLKTLSLRLPKTKKKKMYWTCHTNIKQACWDSNK